jgi:hypothetical protein
MNADDLRWLLQTIEAAETAERLVLEQYKRGRIPDHVMADIARDRRWISPTALQALAAAT